MPAIEQPDDGTVVTAGRWTSAAGFDEPEFFRFGALNLSRYGVTAENLGRMEYAGAEFTEMTRDAYRAVIARSARWASDLIGKVEADG